jgi:USP6 N-terminal-like protein
MSGVKGDGFEEGVERTRARLGNNRQSEQRALNAIADGSEKTKDLSPQEAELLASLDRYGFFTTPSHDRLVLLSGTILRQPLAKYATTETAVAPGGTSAARPPPSRPSAKESARIEKWGRMLQPGARDTGSNVQSWSIVSAKEHKLRARVYKGVPDRWRAATWEILMSRLARTDVRAVEGMMRDYRAGLEKPSSFDVQIDLDVPRTISGHVMFRTRYGTGCVYVPLLFFSVCVCVC